MDPGPTKEMAPWLRGVLITALVLRLAAVPFAHQHYYLSDEREYMEMAGRITAGGDFVDSNGFRSVRAPLYPLILAGIFALSGGSVALAHVLGCLLGTLAVYLGYLLALRIWNSEKSALFAAGIIALHPSLVIYSTLILTETLYIALLLGLFLAAERFLAHPFGRNATLLGALAGCASLTRPVAFGFVPVMLLILFRLGGRKTVRGLALAAGIWILVLAPWTIRNGLVHGELVPVASGAGSSFLTGNNPFATGTWRVEPGFDEWFEARAREEGVADPASLSETEKSGVSGKIALRFIRSEPVRALELALKKSYVFWVYPVTNTDSERPVQATAAAADVLLLCLFVLGLAGAQGKGRRLALLFGAMIYFWIVQAVLHSEARFRLPLVPLAAAIAGHGLLSLVDAKERRLLMKGKGAVPILVSGFAAIALLYGYAAWMVITHRL